MRFTGGSRSRCWSAGSGVWCKASDFDSGSSCPSGMFFISPRAMRRFRLRSLSARGCLDPADTDRPGMLKRAPDSGDKDRCWPSDGVFFSAGKNDDFGVTISPAHRPRPGTLFSIHRCRQRALSSRPRADNDRGRNFIIARAPKTNMTNGQKDLQPRP